MENERRSRRTIRSRLVLFFMFFVITVTTSHFFARYAFENLEKYQIIINRAGQNNEIIEQILNYANQIQDNQSLATALLNADLERFKLNQELLEEGGTILIDGEEITLPAANPQVQPILKELYQAWSNLYLREARVFVEQNIYVDSLNSNQLNERAQLALNNLKTNREQLLSLNNQVIEKYLAISKSQKDNANAFLWGILILNFLLIGLGIYLIQLWVIRPLVEISHVAESIGRGDLNQKVNYNQSNEVGWVASAINEMVDKIRNATTFIKSIEQGDLGVSYSGSNGQGLEVEKDSLAGALINMRERMKTVAAEEEERNWATEGLATFGQILQSNAEDTEALAYEIISNLVDYLGANQGGLFIVLDEEEGEAHLDLLASYAFQRRRYIEKSVLPGEGLVGQAFKDGDTIYITDIPDNYVDITSGLGGAQPRSVLVIPLKLSDRVYGVLEIASFHEFQEYQIVFLEKLGENIASNLNTVRANEKTRQLLGESNRITEQLRQQEQIMLQNMQMLEDTQMEMEKNQEALAAQSFAIKSTLLTAELSMDKKILSANDLFCKALQYREEELVGMKHSDLIPEGQFEQMQQKKLWQDLRDGIPHYGEYKKLAKDGSEIWLKVTYSPIKDKNGRPYKILKLAFDVTEEKRLRLDFKEQLDSFKRSSSVVEFDLEGNIIDANDNFLEMMEYRREEIIGEDHTLIVPEDEKESKSYLALWHKLKQGRYHIGEVKRVTKTGKTVWFQGSFNPILDLNGRPYKIIEFIIDVTARKNAESRILATKEELQQKESNLTALINNTDDAIYTIATNYRVTLFNESARKFYEQLGENLRVSSNVLDLLPKNYHYIWKGFYDRALEGEKFSVEQSIFSEKTNQKFYLSIFFNPILDEQEEVSGVSIFARDITQRKQREMDIADFTKKQAMRTSRIIENQKQNLRTANHQYQQEKLQLEKQISQSRKALDAYKEDLVFYEHLDVLALSINHEYRLQQFNDKARDTFRRWHLYLGPDYDLLDTFPISKFYEWKAYCDRALKGENFSVNQIILNHYERDYSIFSISFQALKSDIQEVKKVIITVKEIKGFAQKLREEKYRRLALVQKRHRWQLRNLHKELELSKAETSGNIHIAQHQGEQLNQVIDLLDRQQTHYLLRVDNQYSIKTFSPKTKALFAQWHLIIQPDYNLLDTFPMTTLSDWKNLLDKAQKAKTVKSEEIIVNTYLKKIFLFKVEIIPEFDENKEVTSSIIKLRDVSHLLPERRAKRKAHSKKP